ncbi:MAG: trypsin-like serine protease [Bdellovibrionota bacterium]|nr:trypsin-like serine protease [Bdellovibrionota bacterium]
MKKLLLCVLVVSSMSHASEKSICGDKDDRSFSNIRPVGRAIGILMGRGFCTLTMISKTCAISAGHCYEALEFVDFNSPASIDGVPQFSGEQDFYEVDRLSIKHNYTGIGDDWAVVRIKKNAKTGLYPGEVQGHMEISYDGYKSGDIIRVSGYGSSEDRSANLAQQTDIGSILSTSFDSFFTTNANAAMTHNADTMGGASGAAIVNEATGKIIGIHTNGGCTSISGSGNAGVIIGQNYALRNAIKSCLDTEKEDLSAAQTQEHSQD